LNKLKTIIVDDSLQFRQAVRSMMKGKDFLEVSGEASNGIEAIDLAFKLQPDVIVMDINMPLMNGFEASAKIKKNNPEIKIIILSVYRDPEYLEEFRNLGLDGYLVKGEDDKNIIETIKKLYNIQ
jgi:DNA-binding NarL/FixJ family response regulator